MEIRTPKIIPGESEGGAGVFTTDYFGTVSESQTAVLHARDYSSTMPGSLADVLLMSC